MSYQYKIAIVELRDASSPRGLMIVIDPENIATSQFLITQLPMEIYMTDIEWYATAIRSPKEAMMLMEHPDGTNDRTERIVYEGRPQWDAKNSEHVADCTDGPLGKNPSRANGGVSVWGWLMCLVPSAKRRSSLNESDVSGSLWITQESVKGLEAMVHSISSPCREHTSEKLKRSIDSMAVKARRMKGRTDSELQSVDHICSGIGGPLPGDMGQALGRPGHQTSPLEKFIRNVMDEIDAIFFPYIGRAPLLVKAIRVFIRWCMRVKSLAYDPFGHVATAMKAKAGVCETSRPINVGVSPLRTSPEALYISLSAMRAMEGASTGVIEAIYGPPVSRRSLTEPHSGGCNIKRRRYLSP